ncbi:MAG TPA: PqqD family protein [Terracidiphilus sp.]|nr:PqqD family protein [Terracidiphilus sp.]
MNVERAGSKDLKVNQLPDGSKVIVDSRNDKVFALNATAGAAWDACSNPTTLSKVTEDMRHSFNPGITEEIAESALHKLAKQNLVTVSGSSSSTTRREVLATLSAVAVPLVVSLTMGEQRAHAQSTGSGTDDDSRRPNAVISHPPNPGR